MFLCLSFFSILVPILLVKNNFVINSISTSDYLSILSSLSGFCFAGMAILISMPNDSLAKLNASIQDGKHCVCMKSNYKGISNNTCIDDLFATMSLGVIVPLVGIIGCMFRPYFHICPCVCFVLKYGFLIFSILWCIHITIHFFMLRSTLINK